MSDIFKTIAVLTDCYLSLDKMAFISARTKQQARAFEEFAEAYERLASAIMQEKSKATITKLANKAVAKRNAIKRGVLSGQITMIMFRSQGGGR